MVGDVIRVQGYREGGAAVTLLTFDQAEASIQDSQPRELILIQHGLTTYPISTAQRDYYYLGTKYVATPSSRLEIVLDDLGQIKDVSVVLPSSHAFVVRWFQSLSPPQRVTVTILRYQVEAQAFETLWSGEVTLLSMERHQAKLTVVPAIARRLQKRLPLVGVDSKCAAILFDPWCKADRNSFTYAAHVTYVDGRNVNIAWDVTVPAGDGWAGQFIHLPTTEPVLVVTHSGLQLTLKNPIAGMKVGDNVTVARACNHSIADCRDIFNNVPNYVGLPNKPTQNPFFPTGAGVGDSK